MFTCQRSRSRTSRRCRTLAAITSTAPTPTTPDTSSIKNNPRIAAASKTGSAITRSPSRSSDLSRFCVSSQLQNFQLNRGVGELTGGMWHYWVEFGSRFYFTRTSHLILKKDSSILQNGPLSFGQIQPRRCNLSSRKLSRSPTKWISFHLIRHFFLNGKIII